MSVQTNKQYYKQYKYLISNRDIFECCLEKVSAENGGCSVIIPHVCNNMDLYGAGFASAVANKFPLAKANYHMLGKKFLKENPGYCQIINAYENVKSKHTLYIANMIAQNGTISKNNPRPLNYLFLAKSMNLLSNFINHKLKNDNQKTEKIEIHCPKFGSGLAGGNWYFISDLIEDVWSQYNVTVHTYKEARK